MQPRVHQARSVRNNLRSVHGCSRPTSDGERCPWADLLFLLSPHPRFTFFPRSRFPRLFVPSFVRWFRCFVVRGIRRRRRRQRAWWRTRPRGTSKGELRTYSVKNVNKPWRCTDTGQFFCVSVNVCRCHRKVLKPSGNKCKDNEGFHGQWWD